MSTRASEARISRRLTACALGLTVMATLGAGGAAWATAAGATPTGSAATSPASSAAGGGITPVTVTVTGSPLTNVTSSPTVLTPAWSPTDTDYVWYCANGSNSLTLVVSSSGTISSGGHSGSQLSIPVTVVNNQAVILDAPGGNQYWVRCLPSTMPHLTVTGNGNATPGYYLTGTFVDKATGATSGYPMILNKYGTPVWYLTGAPSPGGQNVELLPGTHTVAWASGSWDTAFYNLYNLDTGTMSRLNPPAPVPDAHELYTDNGGNHWMISRPLSTTDPNTGQPWDLSSIGYPTIHNVVGCVVQELSPSGSLLWQWDATHFVSPSESTALASPHTDQGQNALDAYHCNSVDVDPLNSANILVSMRDSGVFLINKTTGTPEWKMGGTTVAPRAGEPILKIVGDPQKTISGQHDARFQPNGGISVFDDATSLPGKARGVVYSVNTTSSTATMLWDYLSPSGTNDPSMGSFRIYDSNTNTYDQAGLSYTGPQNNVIDWGHGAPSTGFTEVDQSGTTLLHVAFPTGVLGNRASKVPLSALDLSVLRSRAGTAYPAFAPTVASVAPAAVGRQGTYPSVVVTGTGFAPGATVSMSASSITQKSVTYVSPTELKVSIHVPVTTSLGAGDVSVTTANGTGTCSGCLTVDPNPQPTGTSPPAHPGATVLVTVTGSDFQSNLKVKTSIPGATLGQPSGVTATSFQISVTVPSTVATGNYRLTVTNPDGGIGDYFLMRVA